MKNYGSSAAKGVQPGTNKVRAPHWHIRPVTKYFSNQCFCIMWIILYTHTNTNIYVYCIMLGNVKYKKSLKGCLQLVWVILCTFCSGIYHKESFKNFGRHFHVCLSADETRQSKFLNLYTDIMTANMSMAPVHRLQVATDGSLPLPSFFQSPLSLSFYLLFCTKSTPSLPPLPISILKLQSPPLGFTCYFFCMSPWMFGLIGAGCVIELGSNGKYKLFTKSLQGILGRLGGDCEMRL